MGNHSLLFYMSKKLKVLFCGEASFLKTGYASYYRELIKRLNNNPSLYIAELACYGSINDSRDTNINWRYYANAVPPNDPRFSQYMSSTDNSFGRWRFEKVLIDFKPDVVIDIRDYWMNQYQAFSPLREYFNWTVMPTIDSAPQQDLWMSTYLTADAIFTYSDWARDIINQQTSNKIKYIDTTSPGVDTDIFCMKDQQACRSSLLIPNDSIIIGSVMRNQKRKLIPELIQSVRKVIDSYESSGKTNKKIFLYLHTSYPDYMCWEIPKLLKENRMLNRTLFTYHCKDCKKVFSDVYSGPARQCVNCNSANAVLPSASDGVSDEDLATVYNCFDMYVQYSICEGFGVPQIEAGACGVPVATVNYSAMEDLVNKIDAYPIKIGTRFKEMETQAIRVYPDNDDLINIIEKYLNLPDPIKVQKKIKTRKLTEQHFNWENIVKKWEKYFDALIQSNSFGKWDTITKAKLIPSINKDIIFSDKIPNIEKLSYISNIIKHPAFSMNSTFMLDILDRLDNGFYFENQKAKQFTWNDALIIFDSIISNNNICVEVLVNKNPIEEDFISYANIKDPNIQ